MKVKVYLSIGYSNEASRNDTLEIFDEEIEGLTDDQKEEYIMNSVKEWADNYIEYGYKEIK